MYVCLCHGISDKTITQLVVEQGVKDVREIRKITPLGSQCGKCIRQAKEVIDLAQREHIASFKKAS